MEVTQRALINCGWHQVTKDNFYGVQRWERQVNGKTEVLFYDSKGQRITGYKPVKEN